VSTHDRRRTQLVSKYTLPRGREDYGAFEKKRRCALHHHTKPIPPLLFWSDLRGVERKRGEKGGESSCVSKGQKHVSACLRLVLPLFLLIVQKVVRKLTY